MDDVKNLRAQEAKNRPYIEKFLKKHRVNLEKIEHTDETGRLEPMYFFDDGHGGYTIKGIKDSLEED